MDTDKVIIEKLVGASEDISEQISKLVEQLTPGSPSVSLEKVLSVLNDENNRVFSAKNSHGEIVGMATMIVINKLQGEKKAMIEDVVVDESMRGRGIGKQLIEKALDEARMHKVKIVTLTPRPSREGANIMYQKLGFEKYETNNYKYELE